MWTVVVAAGRAFFLGQHLGYTVGASYWFIYLQCYLAQGGLGSLTCSSSSATIVHLLFASYHTTYRYFSFGTLVVIIVIVTRSITNSKFTP